MFYYRLGQVNISLTTVNSSALVIAWAYPEWDTGRMTVSYDITCSRDDSNATASLNLVVSAVENDTLLSLNTSEGYTCCAAVVTQAGLGEVSCSLVEPVPVTTTEKQDTTSIEEHQTSKGV